VNHSIRIDEELRDRLETAASEAGISRNALIQRYLAEGLEMDRHPGIVFRAGPAGRRPALAGGPDVWEVVRAVNDATARGEAALDEAAAWLGLPRQQVRVAIGYYARHREEVDAWIEALDRMAAEAEAAWRVQQDILR
jgi:hypothetical protein